MKTFPRMSLALLSVLSLFACRISLAAPDAAPQEGAASRRMVVAIPDYLQTNGVVSVKRSMTEALLAAGLLPVALPEMDDSAADEFLARCDAVMVGGGIGEQDYERRCAYEDRILKLAVKRGLTVVGICHGCQRINHCFGGTLAYVPEEVALVHKDVPLRLRTGLMAEHFVTVAPGGSLMAAVFGEGRLQVNSSHKRCCGEVAPGFRVTAVSEGDGVIEAIEHETLPIYGFQFHPEQYWRKDSRFLELIRLAFTGRRGAESF